MQRTSANAPTEELGNIRFAGFTHPACRPVVPALGGISLLSQGLFQSAHIGAGPHGLGRHFAGPRPDLACCRKAYSNPPASAWGSTAGGHVLGGGIRS